MRTRIGAVRTSQVIAIRSILRILVAVAAAVGMAFAHAGCATPVTHDTPSGRPEVTIAGVDGSRVRSELTNMMLNRGYNVRSSTDTMVVFEKPVENALAAALLGSSYDSTPAARVTANIVETGSATRVVTTFAFVTNPGSAFERLTPANNNPDTADFQQKLNEIKAKLE